MKEITNIDHSRHKLFMKNAGKYAHKTIPKEIKQIFNIAKSNIPNLEALPKANSKNLFIG